MEKIITFDKDLLIGGIIGCIVMAVYYTWDHENERKKKKK